MELIEFNPWSNSVSKKLTSDLQELSRNLFQSVSVSLCLTMSPFHFITASLSLSYRSCSVEEQTTMVSPDWPRGGGGSLSKDYLTISTITQDEVKKIRMVLYYVLKSPLNIRWNQNSPTAQEKKVKTTFIESFGSLFIVVGSSKVRWVTVLDY